LIDISECIKESFDKTEDDLKIEMERDENMMDNSGASVIVVIIADNNVCLASTGSNKAILSIA
jgi:serine/threonine protein phosphatase PrpC